MDLSLKGYKFFIIYPGIHIDTGSAFLQIIAYPSQKVSEGNHRSPLETWKYELKNDFEISAFKKYPQLKAIKEQLYEAGAAYASMTGSGSTLYGIFPAEAKYSIIVSR